MCVYVTEIYHSQSFQVSQSNFTDHQRYEPETVAGLVYQDIPYTSYKTGKEFTDHVSTELNNIFWLIVNLMSSSQRARTKFLLYVIYSQTVIVECCKTLRNYILEGSFGPLSTWSSVSLVFFCLFLVSVVVGAPLT